jgi:ketosteroid isomerase-like protein
MSQENVELVHRAFQAFNDRDWDAISVLFTDDVVWRLIGGFADVMGSEFRGHEGLRLWVTDWVDNLGVRSAIDAVFDVDERVAVITRSVAEGGTSGTPATLRSGQVYSFRDGRISAVDNYYEVSDVLEAVGLSEQDAHTDSS